MLENRRIGGFFLTQGDCITSHIIVSAAGQNRCASRTVEQGLLGPGFGPPQRALIKVAGVLEQATILRVREAIKEMLTDYKQVYCDRQHLTSGPQIHPCPKTTFGLRVQQLGYYCLPALLAYVLFVSDCQVKLLHHFNGNYNQ